MMAGSAGGKQVEGREHYQRALLNRATLGESDKALLAAAEPYLRQPWDLDEWGKKMEELSGRYPDDVEILVYLGVSHLVRLQPDAAAAVYEKALAKDPTLLAARVAEADALSMKGDMEGQLKVYGECLKALPSASQCLVKRISLQGQLGHCPAMREDAQRLHSLDAKSPLAEHLLALALHANDASSESVLEAFGRSWALEDAADRARTELEDRAALAAITGDFTGAERRLNEWIAAVADKPDQASHATPTQHLAELDAEIGQPKKASTAAAAYLSRMGAWIESQSGGQTVMFLAYEARAGALPRPELEAKREQAIQAFKARWVAAGRKIDDDFAWMSWSFGHGSAVATEEEAKAAVKLMPERTSRAVERGRWQNIDFTAGRAYALAGAFAKAVPPLRRIASGCLALTDPVPRTQAQLYLGLALEGTGDPDGARAAYRKVVERWGKAVPPSLSAQKARARLLALGDKKR
jgi:tetratricopeptide (TPR) repeat protein